MRAPVLLFLSGPCGAGKTTLAKSARSYFGAMVGDVASIEIDELHTMALPNYEIKGEAAEPYWKLAREHAGVLARRFLGHGFGMVAVSGNCLHTLEQIGDVLDQVPSTQEVYHFTLMPPVRVLEKRIVKRGDTNKPPEWIQRQVDMIQSHIGEWTQVIDVSDSDQVTVWAEIVLRMRDISASTVAELLDGDPSEDG